MAANKVRGKVPSWADVMWCRADAMAVRVAPWRCHFVWCCGVSSADSSAREGEIGTPELTSWWIRQP